MRGRAKGSARSHNGRPGVYSRGRQHSPCSCLCAILAPPILAAAYLTGWRVKTSPVPIKAPYFATVKSNNYLPNALNLMDAQAEGFDQAGGWGGAGCVAGAGCGGEAGSSDVKWLRRGSRGL